MSKKQSRPRLRWLVRGSLIGLLLLALLFAGSNFFLTSKAGQNFLQKNLNRRTHGITWQVSGASWSPWNGITVRELSARIKIPEGVQKDELPPLLELKKTELKPYWGQLIRGKKLFREITLEEPRFNIPAEFLVLAAPTKPAAPPQQAPKPKPKPKPNPKNKPSTKPTPLAVTPKQKPKPKVTPNPKPSQKQSPAPIDQKRFWLRCRNAQVRIYSLKLNKSIELKGLNTNLPLAGPPTKGSLAWKAITLAGQEISASTLLPIEWKNPNWTLPNQDLTFTLPQFIDSSQASIPFQVRLGGQFSPRKKSQDFRLQASLPSQPLPDYLIHKDSRFHCQAQAVAVNFACQGSLITPDSWRMKSSFAMNGIEAFSELRGNRFFFDTARANLDFQNLTFHSPNIALRSERFSLMGNGQLHLGGYLLAVLRFVAEPELAERLTNIAIGSSLSKGWTRSWLKPLETPDRLYRDLHFEGLLPDAMVNTGRKGEIIPLPSIITYLRTFTKREVAEEISPPFSNNPSTP